MAAGHNPMCTPHYWSASRAAYHFCMFLFVLLCHRDSPLTGAPSLPLLSSGIGDLWVECNRKTPAARATQLPGAVHRTVLMSRHTTGKLVVSPYRPQNSVWVVF